MLFDLDGLGNHATGEFGVGFFLDHGKEQAGEIGVQAFVARDELVGKSQAGHETAFFEPEDGGECAGEEDAFDGGKGDETLGVGGFLVADPFESPFGFAADGGNCAGEAKRATATSDSESMCEVEPRNEAKRSKERERNQSLARHSPFASPLLPLTILNRIKQEIPLVRVLDISVDEQAVHFIVNVFNLGLEGVEAFALGDLDLSGVERSEAKRSEVKRRRERVERCE